MSVVHTCMPRVMWTQVPVRLGRVLGDQVGYHHHHGRGVWRELSPGRVRCSSSGIPRGQMASVICLVESIASLKRNSHLGAGAAAGLAAGIAAVSSSSLDPRPIYVSLYLTAAVLSNVINNAATATLLFPVRLVSPPTRSLLRRVLGRPTRQAPRSPRSPNPNPNPAPRSQVAVELSRLTPSLDLRFATLVLMLGCSASFCSPFGYQTNLMVFSAGGYSLKEFALFGVPLQVICILLDASVHPLPSHLIALSEFLLQPTDSRLSSSVSPSLSPPA